MAVKFATIIQKLGQIAVRARDWSPNCCTRLQVTLKKMKEHAPHESKEGSFLIHFSSDALIAMAGIPVKLMFEPINVRYHQAPVLEEVHHQIMHLLIVRKDLIYFRHEHPVQAGDHYEHVHCFPSGGEYVLFIDYTPQGHEQHVSRHILHVAGDPATANPLPDEQISWQEHGYHLYLDEDQPPLRSNTGLVLNLRLEKNGRDVWDLDYYLGALAHVVIISEDTCDYLHVHPLSSVETGPDIRLHTIFPRPGKYKMFVQFSHQGQLKIASLVLRVEP